MRAATWAESLSVAGGSISRRATSPSFLPPYPHAVLNPAAKVKPLVLVNQITPQQFDVYAACDYYKVMNFEAIKAARLTVRDEQLPPYFACPVRAWGERLFEMLLGPGVQIRIRDGQSPMFSAEWGKAPSQTR